MYPLLLVLGLVSLHLLFRASEEGGPLFWTAYAVVTAGTLYTHYFAVLMLPVHLAYLLIHRAGTRTIGAWFLAVGGVAVLYLPWIVLLVRHFQPSAFAAITGFRSSGHLSTIGLLIGVWPLLAVFASVSARALAWLRSRTAASPLSWVAIIVGTMLVAVTTNPGVWIHRYMFMVT